MNTPALTMTPPIGIIVTQGLEVIEANGGLWSFMRHFTDTLNSEDGLWFHKAKRGPVHDIAHIYLIICNRIYGRVNYAGWVSEAKSASDNLTVVMRSGEVRLFPYSHMVLVGPIEKAPHRINMRGFQGFRYVYNPLW